MLQCAVCAYIPSNTAPPQAYFEKETTMLLSIVRFFHAVREYYRNLGELSNLSDRELADIGITRSDIPRLAAEAFHKAA
jgi:uncharacterized protein YjiS (DUF1127 family)